MRGPATYLLVALQWVLVVLGILVVLLALSGYISDVRYLSSLPPAVPGGDSYSPPLLRNLVVGVMVGACAMGIGGVLFYLRRLFLSRHSRSSR